MYLLYGLLLVASPHATWAINQKRISDPGELLGRPIELFSTNNHPSRVYAEYMDRTRAAVERWPIEPAVHTDRAVVAILQPATPSYLRYFAYTIRASLHRLGPRWALQLFYGSEEDRRAMDDVLSKPKKVMWTPIVIKGQRRDHINKNEANWLRLSMDFWGAVPEKYEHVLILESDSLVLKGNGCVDKFLGWDYVGCPWDTSVSWGRRFAPRLGGNGGLTLRRRSAMVEAVNSPLNEPNRKLDPARFPQHEDGEIVDILRKTKSCMWAEQSPHCLTEVFPNRTLAMEFGVERVWHPSPCGFHNPWEFITSGQAGALLRTADFD